MFSIPQLFQAENTKHRIIVLFSLTSVLTVTVFAFDMTEGPGTMVCTVPYAFMVFVGLWLPTWYTFTSAGLGTFLNLIGFFRLPNTHEALALAYNRFYCMFAIWVTAVFCLMHKQYVEKFKAAQAQILHSEKLAATGKLSASIAHEFNNPLYGVRNVLEKIHESVQMDKTHGDLLGMAIRECDRMAKLVANLRDFYRPSSGVVGSLDLHETINDIIALNKIRWREQKILVARNYAQNMPKIEAIPDQIKQVILNVMQNAADSIPKEGGEITITTAVLPDTVEVRIQDTGTGIAPKNIESIFQPFFTTKSAAKGTGLGLSVSHGIIKSHGGDIRVESSPGKGTTFFIDIPIKYSGGGGNLSVISQNLKTAFAFRWRGFPNPRWSAGWEAKLPWKAVIWPWTGKTMSLYDVTLLA